MHPSNIHSCFWLLLFIYSETNLEKLKTECCYLLEEFTVLERVQSYKCNCIIDIWALHSVVTDVILLIGIVNRTGLWTEPCRSSSENACFYPSIFYLSGQKGGWSPSRCHQMKAGTTLDQSRAPHPTTTIYTRIHSNRWFNNLAYFWIEGLQAEPANTERPRPSKWSNASFLETNCLLKSRVVVCQTGSQPLAEIIDKISLVINDLII